MTDSPVTKALKTLAAMADCGGGSQYRTVLQCRKVIEDSLSAQDAVMEFWFSELMLTKLRARTKPNTVKTEVVEGEG